MNIEKKEPSDHLGSQGHGVALGKGGAGVEELLNEGSLTHLMMFAHIQNSNINGLVHLIMFARIQIIMILLTAQSPTTTSLDRSTLAVDILEIFDSAVKE